MSRIYRKIFFFSTTLLFFGMGAITVLNLKQTQQLLYRAKEQQADTILRSLKEKCKYAITIIDADTLETYIDRKSLDDFVEDIQKNESDIVRVMLVDNQGVILSSLHASHKGQQLVWRPLSLSTFTPQVACLCNST